MREQPGGIGGIGMNILTEVGFGIKISYVGPSVTSVPLISRGKPSFSVVRFCVNLRYQAVDVAFSSSVGINHFELVRVFHNSLNYSMANVAHFYLKCMRID